MLASGRTRSSSNDFIAAPWRERDLQPALRMQSWHPWLHGGRPATGSSDAPQGSLPSAGDWRSIARVRSCPRGAAAMTCWANSITSLG